MDDSPTRLRLLLQQRHWQAYRTFQREYNKIAHSLDPDLNDTAPSRAQFARWLSASIKGLPYSDHCLVLEKMFPGWTAAQLFERCTDEPGEPRDAATVDAERLLQVIADRLDEPQTDNTDWGPQGRAESVTPGALAAALNEPDISKADPSVRQLGRGLLNLKQVRRLSDEEVQQLAGLVGCLVELTKTLDIQIAADGSARLLYYLDILNLSGTPLTRVSRELWFEEITEPLVIVPAPDTERHIAIHRIHDTGNLAKFAFQISPPLQPGESARVGYSCNSGSFGVNHYWREEMSRYTRHYTLRVRQQNIKLVSCTAVEEYPDGGERSANDSLTWDYEEDGVVFTLTRDYLRPKQTVTLRWEVIHDSAG
jgi:hypothetical protein